MPTSAIDSLIFRDIFGSPAMREVWSDTFRTTKKQPRRAVPASPRLAGARPSARARR
jgi:hypothetical protein